MKKYQSHVPFEIRRQIATESIGRPDFQVEIMAVLSVAELRRQSTRALIGAVPDWRLAWSSQTLSRLDGRP